MIEKYNIFSVVIPKIKYYSDCLRYKTTKFDLRDVDILNLVNYAFEDEIQKNVSLNSDNVYIVDHIDKLKNSKRYCNELLDKINKNFVDKPKYCQELLKILLTELYNVSGVIEKYNIDMFYILDINTLKTKFNSDNFACAVIDYIIDMDAKNPQYVSKCRIYNENNEFYNIVKEYVDNIYLDDITHNLDVISESDLSKQELDKIDRAAKENTCLKIDLDYIINDFAVTLGYKSTMYIDLCEVFYDIKRLHDMYVKTYLKVCITP